MASEFQANLVLFGDIQGLGLWESGHFRQHLDYNNFLFKKHPPVFVDVYPIMDMIRFDEAKLRQWLLQHELWHEQIRPYANVTNIDLSYFNINSPQSFYDWQELHNAEHQAFDTAFGLG